ncbi:hypothetical protein PFFCH_02817 [Plasmodium falciparum FCH/4]|uniref:dTMP kinase n=1 Tax=Plasmodium falciparum FCH/4 TaxID=1036724 RepID=A0A024VLY0_PLAFA|nr:hypothetical protein PFFCH_02817 [Plasmodium falciparum FCH/4]
MQANLHMEHEKENRIWVVCDRYAYSGVAYSSGALNLNKTWCMNPDQGLIKPDVVFYLNVPPNYAQNRSDYGNMCLIIL